ncbi:hypothetical protein [Streptomyces sp. AC495_CC817]|uniref:hypothetical protein n=1 Tax=Streptomyces sp. AC495_CC817 TaxID=2823900 RepID=UPI001C265BF3|nr:hypothetical protein [Streptomyces sp. AC495_CC817]
MSRFEEDHTAAHEAALARLRPLRLENYKLARWNAIHAARSLEPRLTWPEIGEALGIMSTAAARIYTQDKPED